MTDRDKAVHELLHFRIPNHGKLWKSLMRAHLMYADYLKKPPIP